MDFFNRMFDKKLKVSSEASKESPALFQFVSPEPDLWNAKDHAFSSSFPWATSRRASVHTIDYLLHHGISAIAGEVECENCKFKDAVAYDLKQKFAEVAEIIASHKDGIYKGRPMVWMRPTLPTCPRCHRVDSIAPVVASKKRDINWLFLFLGRTLGICSLEQLKYYCKHNGVDTRMAKDQLLFFVYVGICLNLDPKSLP